MPQRLLRSMAKVRLHSQMFAPMTKAAANNFPLGRVRGKHERRRMARTWFDTSAAVACLAVFLATPQMAQGLEPQAGTGSEAGQITRAPSIRATPERVNVTHGSGQTEISWNTGNGSVGFVFVTANGRDPVPFATGPRGNKVAPWIRAGSYIFVLYGDEQRRTLLAATTVSGFVESGVAPNAELWQGKTRWLVIIGVMVIFYVAVYLSSTGTLRTTFPTEPTDSPRPLHVGRNLLLGIAAFVCIDGIIFHTGLYPSILAPSSYAGRVAVLTRAEKERPPSGLKEVLVLGDSRMAEGFSTKVAADLGSAAGVKFVTLAEPASTANTWYYMLREVDPTARRYWAIVVPYGVGYEPTSAEPLRISMAAPLLRYGDCLTFASAFQQWSGRFRAFTACILRGSAYQSDVADLLEHPLARIRSIQREAAMADARAAYTGRDYDMVGTTYDPATGQMTFPPRLTEAQRQAIRKSLLQPSQSEMAYSLKLQRDWIPRILSRYAKSPTALVLTPVPRGPFNQLPAFSVTQRVPFPQTLAQRVVLSLPEQTFSFLERPDYFFDAFHLNAKGRQKFTEKLVTELVAHLEAAASRASYP
jgi:hypothetical protein